MMKIKKNFLKMYDIKLDYNLINIIDDLVPVITNYIGCLPIVSTSEYWYSPNERKIIQNEVKSSIQMVKM